MKKRPDINKQTMGKMVPLIMGLGMMLTYIMMIGKLFSTLHKADKALSIYIEEHGGAKKERKHKRHSQPQEDDEIIEVIQ